MDYLAYVSMQLAFPLGVHAFSSQCRRLVGWTDAPVVRWKYAPPPGIIQPNWQRRGGPIPGKGISQLSNQILNLCRVYTKGFKMQKICIGQFLCRFLVNRRPKSKEGRPTSRGAKLKITGYRKDHKKTKFLGGRGRGGNVGGR